MGLLLRFRKADIKQHAQSLEVARASNSCKRQAQSNLSLVQVHLPGLAPSWSCTFGSCKSTFWVLYPPCSNLPPIPSPLTNFSIGLLLHIHAILFIQRWAFSNVVDWIERVRRFTITQEQRCCAEHRGKSVLRCHVNLPCFPGSLLLYVLCVVVKLSNY